MTAIAIAIVGTAIYRESIICIKDAMKQNKTVTKIVVKRFRATTFALAILEK